MCCKIIPFSAEYKVVFYIFVDQILKNVHKSLQSKSVSKLPTPPPPHTHTHTLGHKLGPLIWDNYMRPDKIFQDRGLKGPRVITLRK